MKYVSCILTILTTVACATGAPTPVQTQNDDLTRGGVTIPALGEWRRTPNPGRRSNRRTKRPASAKDETLAVQSIGVGYTLFKSDAAGAPVSADPTTVFHDGDRFRLIVEPNADGYLYVFSETEGKPPKMIFPDARLKSGDNRIRAHRLAELPSTLSRTATGEPQWYKIGGGAATEHLYLVVARDPLPNIPIGKDLVSYCSSYGVLEWKPDDAIWNALRQHIGEPVVERRTAVFGRRQSKAESVALTRDVSLDDTADPPAVWQKSQSPEARLIVMQVPIVHE